MPSSQPFEALVAAGSAKGAPPVHLWNPPFCGDSGMLIRADGTWFHEGSPIGRPAMVRLFSSILRKDPDRYVLVTPVEMLSITVEDAPFTAIEMQVDGENGHLMFRTNVDEIVTASAAHPLRFEPLPDGAYKPYVLVRHGLWARCSRSVYLDLIDRSETRVIDGNEVLGVASGSDFFPVTSGGLEGEGADEP